MDPVKTGWVVERWHRAASAEVAADPTEQPGDTADGSARAAEVDTDRLLVQVVGIPGLAAALARELSPAVWEVHEIDADRAVSAAADAVVLDAPRTTQVARVRRAAPRARLLAAFSGPAPGPLREAALQAGVDACVEGTSAAVVASYLGWVSGPLAAPDGDPQLPDVQRGG
ncbi:hypothetical protein [Actinomycetospora sp. TBRC 11914]|uniref:hypothetical protein n=1 Tax=Actinomycetospora sp. TBRC 11914 TaxID=2729387 RepID=UPI00145DAB33|nr:hypothetical protein [Actinomycetospora sp. TBRC 11914]NMO90386.1 hypothetical protein [Actinomycetospora sp. TBRC 11914]